MWKANRHILPGRISHLTHRGHDRQFLLRFAKERGGYQRRLVEAVRSVEASLSTYGERMGWRKRNRLRDREKLLWLLRCEDAVAFSKQLNWALEDAMIHDQLRREAKWSEAIAVGDRAYVEAIEQQIRGRQQLRVQEQGGSWTLWESYEASSEPEKTPIGPPA